jgi:2-polyprenyl-6-methoxyphenol hydroxylase-like FAD-dependent oxidoreductase
VGLATAVELASHGVSSIVVERRPEVSWLRPRAKTTSARTMEHFRRWGLADTLRRAAPLPVAWSDEAVFCTGLLGREITRINHCFGLELTDSELVAEPGQQVAQPLVEHVLRLRVEELPSVQLVTGTQVTAVQERPDGVVVEVVDDGGVVSRIEARYVVGCEGARSVVREAIGARYEGTDNSRPNFNIVYRAPGLGDRVPFGPAIHYWVLNPAQPGLIGRLDLDETWWCIAQGVDRATGDADPQRLVRQLVGDEVEIEVLATDAWQARMLLVDRYASERLFLAGDSAHQNPPWGGHGFNTGVGDAVNIGWKLAAVINGWAPASLLATYELERRPIGAQTIAEAARNMAILAPELADVLLAGSDSDFARVRPTVAEAIRASKEGEFHSLGLTLGYHYANSPLVSPEAAPSGDSAAPDDGGYHPTAAPGHRLPHRWLTRGDSLFDHLGSEFTLMGDLSVPAADQVAGAARSLGIPLVGLALPDLVGEDWRRPAGADLVLVRPDQHVAWRGDRADDPIDIIRRAVGHFSVSLSAHQSDLERTI